MSSSIPKDTIAFRLAEAPITELVTKFGGQPVWLTEPEWPTSRETGEQMRFICQIALDAEIFGEIEAKMAYLFMTDDEEYVDETWDPDGGENAVIIQPNGKNGKTKPKATGPSLFKMVLNAAKSQMEAEDCEFWVDSTRGSDLEEELDDDAMDVAMKEIKIGGVPIFLQEEEYPSGKGWRLLLQIDSGSVPFYVNFGDAGVGYAFLSKNGRSGKFLWQCG